jgi:transcriptional regulator with XRE-family HTH domain
MVPTPIAYRAGDLDITDPVNSCIGKRIRSRRHELGLSQIDVGKALGVSFQQIQKYECAQDAIPAHRLWPLGQVLEVSVGYFFEDLPATT